MERNIYASFVTFAWVYGLNLIFVPPEVSRTIDAPHVSFLSTVSAM
jgi:hypothetical protein